MRRLVDNPEHWRSRAKAVRAVADTVEKPGPRRAMQEIADAYEKLAERAEQRRAQTTDK
jgi:hypothetical protein